MKTALEHALEKQLSFVSSFFQPERVYLTLLMCLGGALIILSNSHVLPVNLWYALFYFFLALLLGLYRVSYLWQVVVFFLPFEIIIFAHLGEFGDVRAYQFGMLALFLAIVILWFQKKLALPSLRWFDGTLFLLVIGALIAFSVNKLPLASVKDFLILLFFAGLYGLGRILLRTKDDLKTFLLTLQVSGVVVLLYTLYQSLAFKYYLMHFMVMLGRPNAVFEEADWLGFFFGLVATIGFIGFLKAHQWKQAFIQGLLSTIFVLGLILTVSRSAWLGFVGAVGISILLLGSQYFFGFFGAKKSENKKELHAFLRAFFGAPLFVLLAFATVYFFSLTRFDLDQRLTSTGTGDQVITIACKGEKHVPEKINAVDELKDYGCQHINLEEQDWFIENGFAISTTSRPDPNIEIRKNLYQQSFTLLKEHYFFGLGWGESLKVFGTDGRGAGLNSSNLFIEIWLGSGLLGIIGFLFFWLVFLWVVIVRLFRKREMTEGFWITILMLSLWVHATIFNLFNAGLLLGTFAALLILFSWYLEKTVPHLQSLWRK